MGKLIFLITLILAILSGCKEHNDSSEKEFVLSRAEVAVLPAFAAKIRTAVTSILIKYDDPSILSFENEYAEGYQNSNCSVVDCHVFGSHAKHQIEQPFVSHDWLDESFNSKASYGEWLFTGSFCIEGLGKGEADCDADRVNNEELVAVLPWVKKEYCELINQNDKTSARYEIFDLSKDFLPDFLDKFRGEFKGELRMPQQQYSVSGKQIIGCYRVQSGSQISYHYYHVLLER